MEQKGRQEEQKNGLSEIKKGKAVFHGAGFDGLTNV
jgi:preprotein translocase subunit YajC